MNLNTRPTIDVRYRSMLILWFALLISIPLYFLMTLLSAPQISDPPPNTLLTVTITASGAVLVLLSFVVKQKLLEKSVEQQRIDLVQQSLVIACAICEVSALLGLLARFLLNIRESYLLFMIAGLGTALHFPRRAQLLSAMYKIPETDLR